MFRPALLALALSVAIGAAHEASAQYNSSYNGAYYGTQRHMSARAYSGEYQAMRPNVVPTFSMPVYGGGYRSYYGAGYGGYGGWGYGGYYGPGYPLYQQPVVIYPPAIYYGFGY